MSETEMIKLKPIIEVDLEELIEYRDGLDEIIAQFRQMNINFNKRREAIRAAGYTLEDADKIMGIMFGEEEG